jgi:PhzF family phenazine biosynthesis protein
MIELTMYQVDAFTDRVFFGNPAAIVPLERWLPDAVMQSIALENNLPETAFIIPFDAAGEDFHLRWFTPASEVDLCGHATLASAYAVFHFLRPHLSRVVFHSPSGPLRVVRAGAELMMDFPALGFQRVEHRDAKVETLIAGLGITPAEIYRSTDYLVVYDRQEQVLAVKPDQGKLAELDLRGVIITAPGEQFDFVSRFFGPKLSIPEDPITGSAHCALVPYWAQRLRKPQLRACQFSPRLGERLEIRLSCTHEGDRVFFGGPAAPYLKGTIFVPEKLAER